MPRRLRIIVNGKHAEDRRLETVIDRARSWGLGIEKVVPSEAGFEATIREAALDGVRGRFDTLVAAGGDGTFNHVVACVLDAIDEEPAIVEGHPPFTLGLVPLGTANDFATAAGIAAPLDAMRLIANAPPQEIDVGTMNGRAFVNMLSGGFGARVTAEADPRLKALLGGAAYVVAGVRRMGEVADQSAAFEGEGPDGPFAWEGRFSILAVGNGPTAGGGLAICEGAKVDDGLLDLTIIPAMPTEDALGHLSDLLGQGIDGLGEDVVRARLSRLSVRAGQPMHVNLDGEPLQTDTLDIAIRPRAVRLRLPARSPVLTRPRPI